MLTTTPDPFITVTDVKTHLKKAGAGDDTELATFAGAACEMIRGLIGEVAEVEALETVVVRARQGSAVTRHRPVLSITSVTDADSNAVIDDTTYELDSREGVITRLPAGRLVITYLCGRDPVPDNVTLAALELAAHLWRGSQNGGASGAPQFTGDSDAIAIPGTTFALPIRVRELLGLGRRGSDMPLVG